MQLLEQRCRVQAVEPDTEPEPSPTPVAPSTPDRALRRSSAAVFTGDAALSLGAVLLSLYVFGYQSVEGSVDELEQTRSVGHFIPTIPLGVAAGVVGGLGMHAMVDGGGVSDERRRKIGVGLTVAGAATLLAGAVLMGTGAAFWPAAENGVTDRPRANGSVNLQGLGLGTMLGSLGLLGPGIGALATRRRR